MPTLKFGGWGRAWGLCLRLRCAFMSYALGVAILVNLAGAFFFDFTGTPSWVLHGYTTREERQIYPRKKKANVHYRESREYTDFGILQNI